MTIEIALPAATDLMEEGHDYLQQKKSDPLLAYTAFLDALERADGDTALDGAIRSQASKMLGVCARMLGNLEDAEFRLSEALRFTAENVATTGGPTFEGSDTGVAAILRDLGAVYATYYLVYRNKHDGRGRGDALGYLALARRCYSDSLRALVEDEMNPIEVIAEREVTIGYSALLEWQAADELPLNPQVLSDGTHVDGRHEVKAACAQRLAGCYTTLKHQVELRTQYLALRGLNFEVYKANLLIREVRVEPFMHRMTHWHELMQLTGPSSESPGRRNHAIVALLFGDRVYSWSELRKARQSR